MTREAALVPASGPEEPTAALPAAGVLPKIANDQEEGARHRVDALSALNHGHGVHWAADITGLPLRFVAKIAAEHRIPSAAPELDLPGSLSLWDTMVTIPCRLILAVA